MQSRLSEHSQKRRARSGSKLRPTSGGSALNPLSTLRERAGSILSRKRASTSGTQSSDSDRTKVNVPTYARSRQTSNVNRSSGLNDGSTRSRAVSGSGARSRATSGGGVGIGTGREGASGDAVAYEEADRQEDLARGEDYSRGLPTGPSPPVVPRS
jgi:hypothetical protein